MENGSRKLNYEKRITRKKDHEFFFLFTESESFHFKSQKTIDKEEIND